MSKILKKATAGDFFIADMGITIPGEGQLTIDPALYTVLQQSSDVITALSDGDLIFNDGSDDITELAYAINIIQGGEPVVRVNEQPPFSAKKIGALKLYTRCTGVSFSVDAGANNCDFSIPFPTVKFNGMKIVNCSIGDYVNLKVLDTPAGLISGVPNYVLNQFGYTVYMRNEYFEKRSDYDADLVHGMVIRAEYYNSTGSTKTIYINYDIHELKP